MMVMVMVMVVMCCDGDGGDVLCVVMVILGDLGIRERVLCCYRGHHQVACGYEALYHGANGWRDV